MLGLPRLLSNMTHHAHSHLYTKPTIFFQITKQTNKTQKTRNIPSLALASPVSLSPISVLSFAVKLLEGFPHVHDVQLFSPNCLPDIPTWIKNVNLISACPAMNSWSPPSLDFSPWTFFHIS